MIKDVKYELETQRIKDYLHELLGIAFPPNGIGNPHVKPIQSISR